MSKYIDAEWLKELYKSYQSYNGKELAVPIGAILANIGDAPSIDIVRCKECKLYEECEYLELGDNDFCSRGERKSNE